MYMGTRRGPIKGPGRRGRQGTGNGLGLPTRDLRLVRVDEQGLAIPGDALHCSNCFAKAVVALDNCLTCLNCGESKCG